MTCELAFLGGCYGRLHRHHIINRSRTRGNKAARKFVDDNGWLFWANVCEGHNVGRLADTKAMRSFLITKRGITYGFPKVKATLADLRKCFKSDASDLTLEGLIG